MATRPTCLEVLAADLAHLDTTTSQKRAQEALALQELAVRGLSTPLIDASACDIACDAGHDSSSGDAHGRYLLDEVVDISCTPSESFVPVSFSGATLVRSNLGGLGGRCVSVGACEEIQDATTPHEIYIRGIGSHVIGEAYGISTGEPIDMIITNTTEYHAWDTQWNGIKVGSASGADTGTFGVVNLLGPRSQSQSGAVSGWHDFSYVELRIAFVTGTARTPIVLPRTYMSFYDFDTGRPQFVGSFTQREAMMVDPAVAEVQLPAVTELAQFPDLRAYLAEQQIDDAAVDAFFSTPEQRAALDAWDTPMIAASTYGVGKDNPARLLLADAAAGEPLADAAHRGRE